MYIKIINMIYHYNVNVVGVGNMIYEKYDWKNEK